MNNVSVVFNALLDNWQVITAYVMSSAAIAYGMQFLRKHYDFDNRVKVWKIETKKFIDLLVIVAGFVFSLADTWLTSGFSANLVTYIPQLKTVFPYITLLAYTIHRFHVSGTWKKLNALLVRAANYNATKQVAPVPAVTVQQSQPIQPKFEG